MRGPFTGFKLKVRRCGQNLGCENSNIMSTKCKQHIREFAINKFQVEKQNKTKHSCPSLHTENTFNKISVKRKDRLGSCKVTIQMQIKFSMKYTPFIF